MGSTVARLCPWSNVFQLKLGRFWWKRLPKKKHKKVWFFLVVDVPGLDFVGNFWWIEFDLR